MRNVRLFKSGGVGIAIFAVALFAAAAFQTQKASYEKICPITFELSPDSILAKNCAAKVESDNAMLAVLLAQARPNFMDGKTTLPQIGPGNFGDTYLSNPTLRLADGKKFVGWDKVLPELKGLIRNGTYIDVQSVRVCLGYATGHEDIDLVARVITVLAYATIDDPVTIEGALCHRKFCPWVAGPCPPPSR
jgi:hypothetical protein